MQNENDEQLIMDIQLALLNTISTLMSDLEAAGITTTEAARDRLAEDLAESLVLKMDEDQARVLAVRYVKNSAFSALAGLI